MFKQAIFRTGIKFGGISALAGFAIILILFLVGINPFGQLSLWSWIFIPVFIFLGIRSFKRNYDPELGFLKALKAGWSIAFFTALFSALLIFIFATVGGEEVMQRHITEMKTLFESSRQAAIEAKVLTPEAFDQTLKELDKTTAGSLALDDFFKKFAIGFFIAVVGAVFFRK